MQGHTRPLVESVTSDVLLPAQDIPFYRLQNCLTGSGDEDDRDISPPSPAMMSMSLGREELDMPAMEDFKETVEKCNKSVSCEDLENYKVWMEEFGST